MNLASRAQRRAFDRRFNFLSKFGPPDIREELAGFDEEDRLLLYFFVIERYSKLTGATSTRGEDGTPILDTLIDFFKWMWESGAFIEIIKIFFMAQRGVMLEQPSE